MKKFLIGLVAGFLLAGLAGCIVLLALLRLGERKPSVPESATLVLRLEGEVLEKPPVRYPLPFLESAAPLTTFDLWEMLRKAEADRRIRAVFFEPRGVQAGWATLEEIHRSLLRLRRARKPVYAYLRSPGAREYYLATAADKIFLAADDVLFLKGLRAEFFFLRKAMDKIGVELEVERAGKYKDAADSFTRTSLAPESREVVDAILDQVYGDLVAKIAQGRSMPPDEVRRLIDDGPLLARKARDRKLVDDLLFEDQALDALKAKAGLKEINKVSHREYARLGPAAVGLGGASRIAVVAGEGTILRGGAADLGDSALWSDSFARLLKEIGDDKTVKGVILRINSPGGDAVASEDILHAARNLSRKKPLVVSMGDVAASGGYYIAMTGDRVLAYPNTITGSIGVIYGKVNLARLYDKLGFTHETLLRGKNAAIDSSAVPLSETGRQKLREGIAATYESFLARVAEGRKRKREEIEALAQGRVWIGAQASGNGLVDELGGLDRAVELVRQKARIPASERVSVVLYPRRQSILDKIMSTNPYSLLDGEELAARKLSRQLSEVLGGVDLRLFEQPRLLRLAPYAIRIH